MSWSVAEIEPRADIEIETENKTLLDTTTIKIATAFREQRTCDSPPASR